MEISRRKKDGKKSRLIFSNTTFDNIWRLRDDLNRMPMKAAMSEIGKVSTRFGALQSIRCLVQAVIQEDRAA